MYKIYKNDIKKIPNLSIAILYRKSLKLIRTYPSIKRDEMRNLIIEEYTINKYIIDDEKKVKEERERAKSVLYHLYTYEAARRELVDEMFFNDEIDEKNYYNKINLDKKRRTSSIKEINLGYGQSDMMFNRNEKSNKNDNDDEEYEYFH